MARYKILLFKDYGDSVGEIMVNALWRSDAIHVAKRVAEESALGCCGYEIWRDQRKVADGNIADDGAT